MTDPLLDEEAAERLAGRAVGRGLRDPGDAPAPVAPPSPGAAARAVRRVIKGAARPVSRRVLPRLAEALRGPVASELRGQVEHETTAVRHRLAAEIDEGLRRAEVERELVVSELHSTQQTLCDEMAQLRDEVAGLATRLRDVGNAIAPGTGLPGVAGRFTELRSRVNDLDRRFRMWVAESGATTTSARSQPPPSPDRAPAPFNYVAFEGRFRGPSADILATVRERYWDVLADAGRVLDVGCGRGELLSALRESGVEAVGVDLDPEMIAEARAAGLEVHQGDAIAFLREEPPGSFGAICAIQLVEHLREKAVREMVELARSRLRPGGVLVVETPNPSALFVLGNSYALDPSHVWPIHPYLMTFLCEQAGYGDIEVRYFAPMSDRQIPVVEDTTELPEWAARWNTAFAQLNDALFGPQDYSVIARVPAQSEE